MSNHQRLDDGMSWRIDTGSIERKPGQGRPKATTARRRSPFVDYSEAQQRGYSFSALSLLACSHRNLGIKGNCFKKSLREGCLPEGLLFAFRSVSHEQESALAWCRHHRDWSIDQWATAFCSPMSPVSA
ncbi:hypothetical protein TNCV_577371 [Trichonephila clavipes]|uniref:Uncharacterized protein n=1 Tax=Trichonephila clavipes TaxID=2585209 RepID=A0A8X6V243_TRICX|nr:hypothetical protein TNCV_577371 [Trichonephila clavipes]